MAADCRRYTGIFNAIPFGRYGSMSKRLRFLVSRLHFVLYCVMLLPVLPAPRQAVPPRCYSGVYFYFAPVRYRKGVLHLVTWPNLIEFCSFLVALITLIIGILDHKNKK